MPDEGMADLLRQHLRGRLPDPVWKEIVKTFCRNKVLTATSCVQCQPIGISCMTSCMIALARHYMQRALQISAPGISASVDMQHATSCRSLRAAVCSMPVGTHCCQRTGFLPARSVSPILCIQQFQPLCSLSPEHVHVCQAPFHKVDSYGNLQNCRRAKIKPSSPCDWSSCSDLEGTAWMQ